ncbi:MULTISPECIES: hypothetical protein [Shewanella]|uniref:Uncharacterized protein n=1 Tax=Shewanella oncorhynchi TaxID=2726434 RepID=A0ABX1KT56_9GAMM|nr:MULTISPECIES: hypothetical protein [Shewanella]MBW3532989.1 hypothetical protein [Shewanella sp. NKUCC06_TVS]NLQ24594.1 hypothetical protein [Shewanella oncorhynchi]
MRKIILALFILTTYSHAATIQCGGTVEKVGLHAPDGIMLKLSSMNNAVFICNPNSEWSVSGTPYITSAETCKSMLSMLMHAKATQADMGSVWFDGDDVPATCSTWEAWKHTNVRYFLY